MGIFGKPFFQSGFGCVPVDYLKDTYPSTWLTILNNQREYIENKSMCGRNYHNYGSMDGEYQDYVYDFFTSGESEDILAIVFDFAGEEGDETEIFGYDTIGTVSFHPLDEHLKSSLFTCPDNGTAQSINVALKYETTQSEWSVRCGIYYHGNLSLLGETEERAITPTSSFAWYSFDFVIPPNLNNGTQYLLAIHASDEVGALSFPRDAGDENQGHQKDIGSYGSLPDPFPTPDHNTYKWSIYCSYFNTSGGEPPFPPPPTVELTISQPEEKTYSIGNISVEMYATGEGVDTIWFNCKNDTSWIFESNQTYTDITQMINLPQASYIFYGWANNTVGQTTQKTVYFSFYIYTFNEYSDTSNALVYGQNFSLTFNAGDSLGLCGNYPLLFDVKSGFWNGSSGAVTVYRDRGTFSFYAENDTVLEVSCPDAPSGLDLSVSGASYSQPSKFTWLVTVTSGYTVSFVWNWRLTSWLDLYFMFGVGMAGLVMMVFAPSWVALGVRRNAFQSDKMERIGYALLIFCVGFGLFCSWLWS